MLKKFILLCITWLFCSVIFYACQKCGKTGHYLDIWFSTFEWVPTEYIVNDNTLNTNDTLYLRYSVISTCIAENKSCIPPFVTTAFATVPTFCSCGDQGFKSAISNLRIYADQPYAGYSTGAEVTTLFSFYTTGNDGTGTTRDTYYNQSQLPQLVTQMSLESHQHRAPEPQVNLSLTQRPGDSALHTFTIKLFTADSAYSTTTAPFKWY